MPARIKKESMVDSKNTSIKQSNETLVSSSTNNNGNLPITTLKFKNKKSVLAKGRGLCKRCMKKFLDTVKITENGKKCVCTIDDSYSSSSTCTTSSDSSTSSCSSDAESSSDESSSDESTTCSSEEGSYSDATTGDSSCSDEL